MQNTHYDLGSLPLTPALDGQIFHPHRGHRDDRQRRRAQLLNSLHSLSGSEPRPDLLVALCADPGPDEWVFHFADALAEHDGLVLTHCERVEGRDGHVAIVVVDSSCADSVRAGDSLCGGLAATRAPDGEVAVVPRIYRQVCRNGATLLSHVGADVLHETGNMRDAVRACLSPATFAAGFDVFALAARTPVLDPLALLQRAGIASAAAIWAGREDDEETVFGVVNALTAQARRAPDLRRRLALERRVEHLLAVAADDVPFAGNRTSPFTARLSTAGVD